MIELNNNDVRLAIKEYADNSFDAIITDPPYEIGFVGSAWDSTGVAFDTELWKEALRVLKPGGHLISFSASRTVHRLAVAIEDAGFEIRDQFNWLYSSGMTKGENLSRRIDKILLNENKSFDKKLQFAKWCKEQGVTGKKMMELIGNSSPSHYINLGQPMVPSLENWNKISHLFEEVPKDIIDIIDHFDNVDNSAEHITEKTGFYSIMGETRKRKESHKTYEPLTQIGKDFDGFRVSLKPAFEPAVVARKPISEPTVADNIIRFGTGAMNIENNLVNGRQPSNVLADDDYFNGKADLFLLQSKAGKSERIQSDSGNSHPTVKPVALMEHLVKLFTPRDGGKVLDMFAGSGSTLVACENLGKDAVGIEMSEEYCEIIRKRVKGIID